MSHINIATKAESVDVLCKYFEEFCINNLKYYLEGFDIEKYSVRDYLELNTYEPEDVELKTLALSHLKIVHEKIFWKKTQMNWIYNPIKFAFVSNSVYWNDMFIIEDIIFVHHNYLRQIFIEHETNLSQELDDIYWDNYIPHSLNLLKKISECIYSIIQRLNFSCWIDLIFARFDCSFMELNKITFESIDKENILCEPNTYFIQSKIPMYYKNDKIYTILNVIDCGCEYKCKKVCVKTKSFSPYWKKIVIELKYSQGKYIEINKFNEDECTYENEYLFRLEPNPFNKKALEITNCVIHN